ncbi:hypothetical protein [Iningainema tapete]|uniref:Uncharacterized protein n=1 Tax=Iningainema tapete BLCC-T55 TaxID=2748662 RepID=A0A8J7CC50_9CYAN|nr:hypothetical protein [Iningainema tapete]MBD2772140.1 hypothetical protein [Iningainema tapete BLCC-T55]
MNNCKILRVLPQQGLEPRQFLRLCFGIAELSPELLLEEETRFQYSSACIKLLSGLLGVTKQAVRKWGNNPSFDKMPQHTKLTLAYINKCNLDRATINAIVKGKKYTPPSASAEIFLKKVFFEGMTPAERLATVTHINFRPQCVKSLSQVLGIAPSTVQEWGQDISFRKMPKYHQHTLGYAIAVLQQHQEQYALLPITAA